MKNKLYFRAGRSLFAILGIFILSACGAGTIANPVEDSFSAFATPSVSGLPSEPTVGTGNVASETRPMPEVSRIDEQGAVSVEITPINLNAPGHTLDFSVALNTHSVDLGMDLAALATLLTDDGHELQASTWEAPSGGHHVQGLLRFPTDQDGVNVIEGVQRITLLIRGLDAPERTFVWER